jgi:hypothetical protein
MFAMGFAIANVRPALPAVSAGDQRLVFELLNIHLCLVVSAIAMIDLDQDIRGSRSDPSKVFQGPSQCFYTPLHSKYSFRPRSIVSRARGCHVPRASFLLKGLSGPSTN